MKNKKVLFKIYGILLAISILSLIILSILGNKNRKGYLSDFVFDENHINKTLELNGLNITETKNLFIKGAILDNDALTNYIFTNESIKNYSYGFRIKYYSKVFRNSDIYGVYIDTNKIIQDNDFIKEIKMNNEGSPFGNLISSKKINNDENIDNINYTLKLKNIFIILLSIFLLFFLIINIISYYHIKFYIYLLLFIPLIIISILNYHYINSSYIKNFIITIFLFSLLSYFILLFMFIKSLYKDNFFKLNKYEIISIILFVVINIIIISYYILNSKEILVYDSLHYWISSTTLVNINIDYISYILWSADYDTIFTIPIALLSKIFGSSRLSFTIIMFFLCYIPTILSGAFVTKYLLKKYYIDVPVFILYLASYFMLPIIEFNLLHSMHMYGAFTFANIVIISYLKLKEDNNLKLPIFLIPLSILFMFIWKRWTLYTAIPIVLFIGIDILIDLYKRRNYKQLINLIIMGAIGISFILVIFYPRFIRIYLENYSDSYSAYSRDIISSIKQIISYFGYISIIFILISLFINKKTIKINIILILSVFISIIGFLKVQVPHFHQILSVTFFIIILFSIFLSNLYFFIKEKNNSFIVFIVFFIPISIFISSYMNFKNKDKLFSSYNLNPIVDKNFNDYLEAYKYMPEGVLIYYPNCGTYYGIELSALDSFYFQFKDVIKNLDKKNFKYTYSHIDFRDGINYSIFQCDYFFASTVEHSCEINQQVSIYPIRVFNNGLNISKAFSFERDFIVSGITNKLYRRIRNNTKEEIYEYVNYFNNYYTNNSMFPKAEDIENKLLEYY